MVTFMCHGVPRHVAKHYFWGCLWECLWMRSTLVPSLLWMGLIQPFESLNRTQGQERKNSFCLPDCFGVGTSDFSCLWTKTQDCHHPAGSSAGSPGSLLAADLRVSRTPWSQTSASYRKYVCPSLQLVLFFWRSALSHTVSSYYIVQQ